MPPWFYGNRVERAEAVAPGVTTVAHLEVAVVGRGDTDGLEKYFGGGMPGHGEESKTGDIARHQWLTDTCNASCSGGSDQKDRGSKPAPVK